MRIFDLKGYLDKFNKENNTFLTIKDIEVTKILEQLFDFKQSK